MRTWLTSGALVAVLALAGVVAFCQTTEGHHGPGARFYVNYERGDDSADGRSAAASWRHAPGDPDAQARAAHTRLQPGDTVLFAPGIRYRGEIRLESGGAVGDPIVLTSGPGDTLAILDGADPAAGTRPCRSADDCGGVADWGKLTRVDFAEALPPGAALFTDQGLLFPAQSPAPADIFNSDDVGEYIEADGGDLAKGVAKLPDALARRITGPGERRLALWTWGNMRVTRDVLGLDGNVARFDPTGLRFYTDRPDRIAVMGHPALVERPGEYAFLDDRKAAVAYLPPGARTVLVARGRGGIDINGQSFVTIRNLAFENMADDGADIRTGIAIGDRKGGATGLTIEGNRFHNFWMPLGQGPIILRRDSGLDISDNHIESVVFGSGMRLGDGSDFVVKGNDISRIGRTGVMLMNVTHGLVAQNYIHDAKGVHGNGLSAYLGNNDVKFLANTVVDTRSPATFKGVIKGPVDNALVFANNLFVATPNSLYAIAGWGGARNVVVENNVLIGGKRGFLPSKLDEGVIVRHNVLNGLDFKGAIPPGWSVLDNKDVFYDLQAKGRAREGPQAWIGDAAGGGQGGQWSELCRWIGDGPDATYKTAVGASLRCPAAGAP